MKIKILAMVTVICLLLCAKPACALDKVVEEGNEIVVYSVNRTVFNQFLTSPSREILTHSDSNSLISAFESLNTHGKIKRETLSSSPKQVDIAANGTLRIGQLPVYQTLIAFLGNREAMQTFLLTQGCNAEIVQATVIQMRDIPVTAWLETDQGNLFLAINESSEVPTQKTEQYTYKFYTYEAYCNQFGVKEGRFKVNGKNTPLERPIEFQNRYAYMPMRTVMEALGAKVSWDAEKQTVLLSCNKQNYILNMTHGPSLTKEGERYNLLLVPPGGSYDIQIVHGRTIADHLVMRIILTLMDAELEIDDLNYEIEIKSISY